MILTLALALAAAPAPATDPALQDRVEELLGAIHGPIAPDAFRALGPGAEDVLAGIARSGDLPLRRIRALEALAGLGGVQAEAVHREVLASAAPRAVRRGAARGLGRLLRGPEAARALRPVLEGDRDAAVRAAAADALALAAPAEACAAVRARARLEPDPLRMRGAVEACRGR